jgi:hypothetical protein
MANPHASRLWTVGSELARALDMPRTTLLSAATTGRLRTWRTGCGRLVCNQTDVERWAGRKLSTNSTK